MIKLIKSTFYKENITKRKLAEFIINTDKLSFGVECEKFEKYFAKWQGRKDSVFYNSGSSANLALFQTLKNMGLLRTNDKIAFSSLTWSTNVMPIIQMGMVPVPVDIDINTLNISSSSIQNVLDKYNIKALFITNLLGFCSDIDVIRKICNKRNIILLEDNCESMGTVYKGNKLGNYGLASSFSFYVGHHMSTIEGGAVATDDVEFAQMLRLVRAHGWDRNLPGVQQKEIRNKYKIKNDFIGSYTFYDLGYNFRPTEINGYLGNLQLKYIDEIINKRQDNFHYLAQRICKNDNFIPLKYDHIDTISNFAFPVICKNETIKEEMLKKCNGVIEVRPIVGGDMTDQPFYKKYNRNVIKIDCFNTNFIYKNGFYFGNNPEMTGKEISEIIKILT